MRPRLALNLIVKDEMKHLPRLFDNVSGLFDEIVVADTGSADGTRGWLRSPQALRVAGCPVKAIDFQWCDDFGKARQAVLEATDGVDYVMWLDADDEIHDRKAFLHFRDHIMHSADYWLATYDYHFDQAGNPDCSFIRERVVKTRNGFNWKYPVHECLVQTEDISHRTQMIQSWKVNHLRDDEDLKADTGRNLKILEQLHEKEGLCARMLFYFGKELFENGRAMEAYPVLKEACAKPDLDMHDRITGIQFAVQCAFQCNQIPQVFERAYSGLQIAPGRAELWCLIGDAHLHMQNPLAAIPAFQAARFCRPDTYGGTLSHSPDRYWQYPTVRLAEIYCNIGEWEVAKDEAEAVMQFDRANGQKLINFIQENQETLIKVDGATQTEDFVITTPPYPLPPWDEELLAEKGLGGSETAAIEMARLIKLKTGRPVKIFQPRADYKVMPSGVEMIPIQKLVEYRKSYIPHTHIAWRHAAPLFDCPSYVWSHDLMTQGVEKQENYTQVLCLSEFHKNYMMAMQGVSEDKIRLTRNGIDQGLFHMEREKVPYKVIFSSSPDRGLDRCICIVKRLKEKRPEWPLEFHCFYGFHNMKNGGLKEEAERLEKLIEEHRDFVHYHGNVDKPTLIKHFQESVVWLYPADFIETYCITVLEALCSKTFPLVRNMGALPYTLKPALDKGMAQMLDSDAVTEAQLDEWARYLELAIEEKKWQTVDVKPEDFSWSSVSAEWIRDFSL